MLLEGIDHIVLTVRDVDATCEFYAQVLGMEVRTTPLTGRKALHFGHHKINLHQAGHEFSPKAQAPTPGAADFCLLTTTPLTQVMAHIQGCGVEIIEGPVPRLGARGTMVSVYFHDPDGNLVEVANLLDDTQPV